MPETREHPAEHAYFVWAALLLGVTVGLGTWLRAVFVWPALKGPFIFGYLVHAHSHVGFFGWVTMALFGVIVRAAAPSPARRRRLALHAHALGAASVAALVAFALRGYDAVSIGISAVHVALWWAFALPALRALRAARPAERRFFRASLVFLLVAGTATLLPGILLARGVHDPWLKELGVKLFLTPFIGGFLGLGVMGAVHARTGGRLASAALGLTCLGVLPSALLFVAAPPPVPALLGVGRAGSLLLGAGGVLFAADVLAARIPGAILRLVGAAAALKGALEIVASLGLADPLMHDRSIVLAYLHLTLLGVITPALALAAFRRRAAASAWVALHALGLAGMCGALVGLGWPLAARVLAGLGLGIPTLFPIAAAGGAASAVAVLALLREGRSAPHALPRRGGREAPDAPAPRNAPARAEAVRSDSQLATTPSEAP
ncbi:MAG TPA: hypothetical protein VFQ38_01740 [Longimicrobiales bacterium]|nr:hypothetical protein [Longimicrobiales bacterium]